MCRPSRTTAPELIARWAPAGFAIIHRFEDVYQFSGSMTKIQGGHTIKAGVEYRKYHENYFQPNTPNGSLTFSRNQTAQNPLVSSSTQGDGLASALLGFGSGGVMSIDYPTAQTAGYFGTYINDDWRISRRLTLNLGLRYDFDIPRTDRYNRINWLDLRRAFAPCRQSAAEGALPRAVERADAVRGRRSPLSIRGRLQQLATTGRPRVRTE